jgi:4-hydroxybenzoate polyprenyltransferase
MAAVFQREMVLAHTAPAPVDWRAYLRLMRLDRPVGTLLLLWPTLAALFLAAEGLPDATLLVVFTFGTLLMRSAGCVINDYFDRDFDGHVQRTRTRPLATGALRGRQALVLFFVLVALSATLLLFLNRFTQLLAVGGLAIAAAYPLMKRHTYLPQVVLGAAFSWGMVMAYGAVQAALPPQAWLLFVGSLFWIVAYDTLYAMVDRDDDVRIGIKSTAILFGAYDRHMVAALQALTLLVLILFGVRSQMGAGFYLGLTGMAALFAYQQYLVRDRHRDACFAAFVNNIWAGFSFFLGTVVDVLIFA